ncbi:MAG: T9SS type A sorting domain-containing protein [Bacteroidales bacterium]|nr:T9SS type A sorting domain-containing protein [Bacteroidales bacterium]
MKMQDAYFYLKKYGGNLQAQNAALQTANSNLQAQVAALQQALEDCENGYTGVAGVQANAPFRVFSNPAKNELNVELERSTNGTLTLFDLNGRVVGARRALPPYKMACKPSTFRTSWQAPTFFASSKTARQAQGVKE